MKILGKHLEMMLMFIHVALIFKRDSAVNHYSIIKVKVHVSPFRKQYERFGRHKMLAPVIVTRDTRNKITSVTLCLNTAYHHVNCNTQLMEILVNDINRRIDNEVLSFDKVA